MIHKVVPLLFQLFFDYNPIKAIIYPPKDVNDFIGPQPVLVGQGGLLNGYRWFISGSLLIGRGSSCDIVISNQQVSREHAQILVTPQGYQLQDLGSKNGTFLNGKPLTENSLLKDGDMIQIALAQEFIYLGQDATIPLAPSEWESSVISYFLRLRLEKKSRRVWVLDQEIDPPLSSLQFDFLTLLVESGGRVLSRTEVINSIWGSAQSIGVTDQALDALVRRLRERISAYDQSHDYVITVRGQGYRLDNPPLTGRSPGPTEE
jgi:DNA-binding winged helix-turn-helix (wHTH) protein